jgi:hypothetical protein
MRLLGWFAIVLLLLGLGLGWFARRRWGPLRSVAPWAIVAAVAPLHAVIVALRGLSIGVEAGPLLAYAARHGGAVRRRGRAAAWALRPPALVRPVPLAQALLQTLATSALGPAYAAAGRRPARARQRAVVAIAIVALGAGPGVGDARATPRSGTARRFAFLWRSGRLRS